MEALLAAVICGIGLYMFFAGLNQAPKTTSLETRLDEMRQGSTTAYDEILLSQSASRRWVKPLLRSFAKISGVLPGFKTEAVREKLDNAGMRNAEGVVPPESVQMFLGIATITAIGSCMFIYIVMSQINDTLSSTIAAVVGGIAGFWLPYLFLYLRSSSRRTLIKQELPDFLDLLSIPLVAGEGFDQALKRTVSLMRPTSPLAQELSIIYNKVARQGQDRRAVWRAAAVRLKVEPLSDFVSAFLTGMEQGISVLTILAAQAERLRVKRFQAAEAAAATAPLKMAPAIVLFFLPAILLMALGPLIIPAIFGSNKLF